MEFFSSTLYYVILILSLWLIYEVFYYTQKNYIDNKFSLVIKVFFINIFLGLYLYPSFVEINKEEYLKIKEIKEQYPELNNYISKVFKDNKITISEGISIINKAKDTNKKQEQCLSMRSMTKELEEVKKLLQQ